jgi:hypothetical protein
MANMLSHPPHRLHPSHPQWVRRSFHVLFAWTALMVAGCAVDDNTSVFIQGNLAPDKDCLFAVNNPFVASPTLDISFTPRNYIMHPLLTSQLLNRASLAPLRADPNTVFIEGAVVAVVDAEGAEVGSYTVFTGATIPSARLSEPGQAVGAIEVVPPSFGDTLVGKVGATGATLNVRVRAFGRTSGNTSIETGNFQFPLTVCNGCLRQCITPTSDSDATVCSDLIGQDSLVPVVCE